MNPKIKKPNGVTNRKERYQGFSKIDKTIKHAAKQYNLENALFRHKALKYWQEVAGAFVEEAKNLTQAVDLQKGVLTVACLSKEVASKLKMLAQKIISALNDFLGTRAVHAIYIEV